ncbi:MAG: hypothetical protein L0K86_21025 [Actinomycetia bacterium]|nr:hypothetical protein [Actinomycetes bacterium]
MVAETDLAYMSIRELESRRDRWHADVRGPTQLPEPALVLNLDSRRKSDIRTMKHVHQMCILHRENFWTSNQIKQLYLVDAFLTLSKAENPLGLYAIARSILELSALLHEVRERLVETTLRLTEQNWRQVGETFFGLITRARFATTHPTLRDALAQGGFPSGRLKPFNITHCVTNLAAHQDHRDAATRYEALCDFVHHNLGSSTTANSGTGVADAARSSGGGVVFGNSPVTITQYEYPARGKTARALNELAPDFLRDALACVQWLNLIPDGPFPPELLEAVTGSRFGFEVLREPRSST